jgi:hypothetical protein
MAKSIVAQIAELEHMPVESLREKWSTLYEGDPPKTSSRKQLVARLAYRLQELTFGGLSQDARVKLEGIAAYENDLMSGKTTPVRVRNTIPGTLYVREWQGQRIEVTALDSGFEYAGKIYRSLSAIATEVTGTKWNGKLFFGLLQQKKGEGDAQ